MKWYGKVGFEETVESAPGVYEHNYIEREYFGDVMSLSSRWQTTENVNDDLKINMKISIIADTFLYEQFPFIKYIEFSGHKWSVTEITPNRPRIDLVLGGLYNGQ